MQTIGERCLHNGYHWPVHHTNTHTNTIYIYACVSVPRACTENRSMHKMCACSSIRHYSHTNSISVFVFILVVPIVVVISFIIIFPKCISARVCVCGAYSLQKTILLLPFRICFAALPFLLILLSLAVSYIALQLFRFCCSCQLCLICAQLRSVTLCASNFCTILSNARQICHGCVCVCVGASEWVEWYIFLGIKADT